MPLFIFAHRKSSLSAFPVFALAALFAPATTAIPFSRFWKRTDASPAIDVTSGVNSVLANVCIVNHSGRNITKIGIWGAETAGTTNNPNFVKMVQLDGSSLRRDSSACRMVAIDKSWLFMRATNTPFEIDIVIDDGTELHIPADAYDALTSAWVSYNWDVVKKGNGSYTVWRHSGGNSLDIIIRDSAQPDNSNWMGRLLAAQPDIKFNQITMPSAHDAGMYRTMSCMGSSAADAQTQQLNTSQMLRAGVRYFDFRAYAYIPAEAGETPLAFGHWALATNGCFGGYVQDSMAEIANFLKGPGANETVVAYFSHPSIDGLAQEAVDYVINTLPPLLQLLLGDVMLKADNSTYVAEMPLGQLKAKVIVALDGNWQAAQNAEQGIIPWKAFFDNSPGGLLVYDNYANHDDLQDVMTDQLAKQAQYGGFGKKYLFLNSWTCTGSVFDSLLDLVSLSASCNGGLGGGLITPARAGTISKPNLINLDYFDPWNARSIVDLNFW